jgi:hypothetical protein
VRKSLVLVGLGVLTCSLLTACAARRSAPRPTAKLTGMILQANGEPVTGGTIQFNFGAKGIATGVINPDGSFVFNNLPAAAGKVAIETDSVKKAKASKNSILPLAVVGVIKKNEKEFAPIQEIRDKMPAKEKAVYVPIAPRYADAEKSGLTIAMGVGSNRKVFTLEKE